MNDIKIVRVTSIPRGRRFRCDRQTALGNPFVMQNDSLAERNRVCDAFAEQILNPTPEQLKALRILWAVWQESDIEIACWCAPLRCHCESIRDFLLAHEKK